MAERKQSPLHGGVDRNAYPPARLHMQAVASSRRRGSKQAPPKSGTERQCRLFTEAWIETMPKSGRWMRLGSRLFTEAWIETLRRLLRQILRQRRLFTEAWIETAPRRRGHWWRSSPLHGGVDRNWRIFGAAVIGRQVASSRRRGSKPFAAQPRGDRIRSPLHGGVDRNAGSTARRRRSRTSPLHGGVDRNRNRPALTISANCRLFTEAWIETTVSS